MKQRRRHDVCSIYSRVDMVESETARQIENSNKKKFLTLFSPITAPTVPKLISSKVPIWDLLKCKVFL